MSSISFFCLLIKPSAQLHHLHGCVAAAAADDYDDGDDSLIEIIKTEMSQY